MTESAIAFAGKIGSGKSTVAQQVADRLNLPRISFSSAVRAAARERSLGEDREALQDLGEQLIAEGWISFCQLVLKQSPSPQPVIDGIRHIGAVDSLKELLAPTALYLVYLDVPEETRLQRLFARGLTPEQIHAADDHDNESELPQVRTMANIILANDRPLKVIVDTIVEALESPS